MVRTATVPRVAAVALAALVALGWGRQPKPPAAKAEESPVTQAMDTFYASGYETTGRKSWEMKGTTATVEGQVVSIQHPDGIGYQPDRITYLTSSVAQMDQVSHRIRFEHDVSIRTNDRLWLSSPQLYWLPDRHEMVTDEPVRLETDHMLVFGRGATGRQELKQAVILRDIEVILNPKPNDGPGPVQHVLITCDGPLSFDNDQQIAIFEQNVHVKDPQGDLYSDKLVAYLDQTTRTIRYAEATGHVRIVQTGNTAAGERAIYEPTKGKLTLVGSPSLLVTKQQDRPSVINSSIDAVRAKQRAQGAPATSSPDASSAASPSASVR